MKELFDQIRHYGTFLSDFECTNDLGMAIRVRLAELDGKKYFIVQCNGNVYELLEIRRLEHDSKRSYFQRLHSSRRKKGGRLC